ncbi:MAG: ankyrin repeat domain-containing protein [Tannerellaceae bacterium]|nr:ankyrin repeat domain-containing protein [Tannerellaceae bacterium]
METHKSVDFFMLKRAAIEGNLKDSIVTIIQTKSDWKKISKDDQFTLLILSCEKDSTGSTLAYLIEKGIDIHQLNKHYEASPLHYAAKAGSLENTKILVENGLDVNIRIRNVASPLCFAAAGGSLQVATYLVNQGAQLVYKGVSEKASPLFNAAGYGHADVFFYLIELIQEEIDWNECFRRSIYGKNLEIIKYFVEKKGMEVDQPLIWKYPIEMAAESYLDDTTPIMEYFLSKGASLQHINKGDHFPWAFRKCNEYTILFLLKNTENPPIQCSGGGEEWCGLAAALDDNRFKLAEYMLQYETDFTFRGKPLVIYFTDGLENSAAIIEFLIKHKINEEYYPEAFLNAALHNDTKSIEVLLNAGVDINTEQEGKNALCFTTDNATAELLVEKGINFQNSHLINSLWENLTVLNVIMWKNEGIKLPQEVINKGLHQAAKLNQQWAVYYFLSKKADPNCLYPVTIPATYRQEGTNYIEIPEKTIEVTPFMANIIFGGRTYPGKGQLSIAELLVKAGTNLNLANKEGLTVLHYAAMPYYKKPYPAAVAFGSRQDRENGAHAHLVPPPGIHKDNETNNILKYLIESGARLNIKDKEGKTPLMRAIETNYEPAIRILQKAGAK